MVHFTCVPSIVQPITVQPIKGVVSKETMELHQWGYIKKCIILRENL